MYMESLNDNLMDINVKQSKCTLKCYKIIGLLLCNGFFFAGGYLFNKYLDIKIDDGSL